MEFRTIRQTSHIDGINRNPGADEHDKSLVWDNTVSKFKYVSFTASLANSKTNAGYVAKGDDASLGGYIWKLDSTKNPAWRKEDFLVSATRVGNSAVFTMNDSATKTLAFGALAWLDNTTGSVDSVFGRFGAVIAQSGDYTAAQVTNAFNKPVDTLDAILEGITNKHFTTVYKTKVDDAYAAMHTHLNKPVLDSITDAGGGIIPSAAQISDWDTYGPNDEQNVMDTVDAFIQDNTGITWVYDDLLNTLTPTVDLGAFTTDDLPESATKKYYTALNKTVESITLPSNTTVAGRCSSAISGVDYPTGWTLTPATSEYDLLITHSLGRKITDITVYSIDGSDNERILPPFSSAYTGVYVPSDGNSIVVEGLSTKETRLRVNIVFV